VKSRKLIFFNICKALMRLTATSCSIDAILE
jgi:hypothetical protein